MKRVLFIVAATLLLAAPAAAKPKPCGELKSEIEEKIKKNGVQTFTLEVVAKGGAPKSRAAGDADANKPKTAAGQGKVVGSCEGGTKQIIYKK